MWITQSQWIQMKYNATEKWTFPSLTLKTTLLTSFTNAGSNLFITSSRTVYERNWVYKQFRYNIELKKKLFVQWGWDVGDNIKRARTFIIPTDNWIDRPRKSSYLLYKLVSNQRIAFSPQNKTNTWKCIWKKLIKIIKVYRQFWVFPINIIRYNFLNGQKR